jgi:hypothetical protein
MALLLVLTLRAYALEPSGKYVAPPTCSDPDDPKPVKPALKSRDPRCEHMYEPSTRAELQREGNLEKCDTYTKADMETLDAYERRLVEWGEREAVRERCAQQQEEQREAAAFAHLPRCPEGNDYLGKSYDIVWDDDSAVIVRVAGNGADPMHPKPICRLTKAQEKRVRAVWLAECEREPDRVLHTESIGLGCWKIVDQCGEKRGTVCSEQ